MASSTIRPVWSETRCKDQYPIVEPSSATASTSAMTLVIRREKEPDSPNFLVELAYDMNQISFSWAGP